MKRDQDKIQKGISLNTQLLEVCNNFWLKNQEVNSKIENLYKYVLLEIPRLLLQHNNKMIKQKE